MRIRKSAAVSSPTGKAVGTRTKKKHKRLDAINDENFNRNCLASDNNGNEVTGNINNEGGVEGTSADLESVRRSTRVRRAPVLLDASPPPSKKKRKVVKSVETVNVKKTNGKVGLRSLTSEEDKSEGEEDGGEWKSRLRTARGRSRGKRKLFEDLDDEVIKLDTKEFSSGLMIVKSKRSGRAKPSNVVMDGKTEVGSCSVQQHGADKNGVEIVLDKGNADILRIVSESGRNEEEALGNSELLNREEASELGLISSAKEFDIGNANGVGLSQNDKKIEEFGWVKEGVNHDNDTGVKGVLVSQPENGNAYEVSNTVFANPSVELPKDEGETKLSPLVDAENEVTATQTDIQVGCLEEEENLEHDVDLGGMSVDQRLNGCYPENGEDNASSKLGLEEQKDKSDSKVKKSVGASTDTIRKSHIKEGRRCGLCGGATDGRPPKKLVQEIADSDHEACSGSSASEEPNYDLCDGFGDEPGWLGRLLGPINDRFGIAGTWVHQHCALWSPEVYFAGLGCLKNVRAALCRGRALKCTRCGRRGATIGCRVDRCPRTYHLPCARADSCIFDHRKFLIACTDHRSLFQPQGDKYSIQMKKLKAKKELRKIANDAWTKDIEAEEKWFENCGEDEEFLKRESKRLHRDMLRIAPVHIGGSESEHGKLFEGWESVAGLQDVIRSLKEVVILPLLYPEFFSNLGLTPPRGVLLHGYPGTGKTLVVRALIGSCARGDKRIAYFARKGADCLGKYVGDAERQLRLLFQLAEKSQPSIIFFDEIDGLAPRRTRQQDQTHSSVVSTLLALMDGLKSRGSVVVIGATNRPEAVDPALRRPGRFDREIYFPLPSTEDRASILSLHTQKWPKPLTGSLLKWIARETAGFAGADLQALCTQAAMTALKRNCPLKELLLAATKKPLDGIRAPLPAFVVEERDWLEALSCAPPPCSLREAGMAANSILCSPLPSHLISCLLQPLSSLLVLLHFDERLSLPPPLSLAARMVGDILVSALDRKKMPINSWRLHLNDLLQNSDVLKEIEEKLFTAGVLVGDATFAASGASNVYVENDKGKLESSKLFTFNNSSSFRSASHSAAKTAGFRILISGGPRSGQRHLASCLLNCFIGNVEIHKVDLATISQEGRGDLLQGLTQLLELWAINKHCDDKEEDPCSVDNCEGESVLGHGHVYGKEDGSTLTECIPTDIKGSHVAVLCASREWSSFIEQVDSLCPSTSLMFLATSEVPYDEIPLSVRRFFKSEINELSPQEYTVPRFVVRLSGQFKSDMLISSSALKLSKDVAQLIVELIHHRNHIQTNLGEESTTHRIHGSNAVVAGKTTDNNHSADKPLHETEPPGNSLVNSLPQSSNRNLKGKSNLILAISTFGYQVLRYPHFAELCWVTSKLKDGPCADVNGPWKDWPFNSCIVRPTNSSEKVAINCSPGNHNKNNEKFGLVRGLVAVGLSAYRGVYTSLREVSLEVRVVLELLVELINHKIENGKDKYQFGRILSQVAYLEDMVNNWSYTLQRLDAEAQMLPGKLNVQVVVSPDNKITCTDNITQSSVNKLKISDSDDLQVAEETSTRRDSNHEGITRQTINTNHQTINTNHSVSEVCLQDADSTAVELTAGVPEEWNAPDSDSGKLATFPICEVLEEDSKSKMLDEFASAVPTAASDDDQRTTSRICSGNLPSSCNICNQTNSVPVTGDRSSLEDPDNSQNEHHDLPNAGSKASAKAGHVCFYSCCSVCLHTLHNFMIKLILHEWKRWERNGEHGKVEDVHDVVGSFSVNLLSRLRRALVTANFRPSVSDMTRFSNHETSEYPVARRCLCKITENSLIMPSECCLGDGVVTQDQNSPPRLDFVYKDGVLAPMETETDVSVHCKFDNLCLCALIEWLCVATEQRP